MRDISPGVLFKKLVKRLRPKPLLANPRPSNLRVLEMLNQGHPICVF